MSLTRVTSLWALTLLAAASTASAQVMDDLNGLWTVTLDGQPAVAMTESYNGHVIRLLPDGNPVFLDKKDDTLTSKAGSGLAGNISGNGAAAGAVTLKVKGLSTPDKADDQLTGTWFGKNVTFKRDLSAKAPIELDLARGIGDRPWVRFMREVLIPKSAEDRETYHKFDRQKGGAWIMATELGHKGYWITKGWVRDQATFDGLFQSYHGVLNSPRSILAGRFNSLLSAAMRPNKKSEIGLALSSLGMYFSTASGGSVRLIITNNRDSIVYYITDRRAHERTGLVVNATPTHKPLASSFGKWQNDAGEMVLTDDDPYDRAVLELMVKSNTSSMNQVSGTGRSAFTDYMGIMAIEDQRGVMFGDDDLDWGRNMTQASFDISIIRALSHGQSRKKPAYRAPSGEKTITDEALTTKSSVEGQLVPSRSITKKSVRITATGLPAVVDDGEGTLYAEGTNPNDDSLGSIDYDDGSYDLSWKGFSREARIAYKDGANAAQTRTLKLTAAVDATLGDGKIKPSTVRIKCPGFPDLEDDGDGSLYDVGANHDTADSRGYLDYDDGSFNVSLDGVPTGAITAAWKTTTDAARTQTLQATIASSGLIDPLQVVPGSLRITAGNGAALVDDGKGSLKVGNETKSRGRIDYASGSYSARWDGVPAGPIAATFRYAVDKTMTVQIDRTKLTAETDAQLARKKVTPKSVRVRAAGMTEIVDDGEGTLYDKGTDSTKDENQRGYVDYAGGSLNVTWKGLPTGAPTVTYKTKSGDVVLTNQNELAMQVIIDGELRPGTPSYIDVCNGAENALEGGRKGGDDCQVGDLYQMEELTTKWLRAEHAAVIDRFERALQAGGYTPGEENLFNAMTIAFYDAANFSKVTQAQGNAIVEAGLNVFKTIRKDSKKLEAYFLANGVTKSDRWAPRASGF